MSPVLSQSALPQSSALFGALAGLSPDTGDGAGVAVFTLNIASIGQTETASPVVPAVVPPTLTNDKVPVSAAELLASLDRSARTAVAPAPILVAVDPKLPNGTIPLIYEEQLVVATPTVVPTPPVVATSPVMTPPVVVAPVIVPTPADVATPPVSPEAPAPIKRETGKELPTIVPPPFIKDSPVKVAPPIEAELPVDVKPGSDDQPAPPAPPAGTVRLAADTQRPVEAPLPVEAKLPTDPKKSPTDTRPADTIDDDRGETDMSQPLPPVAQPMVAATPVVATYTAAPVVAQVIVAQSPVATEVKAPKSSEAKVASRAAPAAPTLPVAAPAQPEKPMDIAPLVMPRDPASVTEPTRKDAAVEVSVTMLSDMASDADTVPTFTLPTGPSAAQPLASASSVQQPAAAADVMINRHLDLVRGDAWLDTLAQDIAAIAGKGDRLKFALQPERLGKLDVEVSRQDNGVAVQMTTRSEEARAIIAAAQPRLIDELRANGTRVVAADVAPQMNAQTNGQSSGSTRPNTPNFIEAAVEAHVPAADVKSKTTAAGRYA